MNSNHLLGKPQRQHCFFKIRFLFKAAGANHFLKPINVLTLGRGGKGKEGPRPQHRGRGIRIFFPIVEGKNAVEGAIETMPLVEGWENILAANATKADTFVDHGLKAVLKAGVDGEKGGRERAIRGGAPRGPRNVVVVLWMFRTEGKINIAGDMWALVPVI